MSAGTHTLNTPQPYAGGELGGPGQSGSESNANATPTPATHGAGASAGATASKSSLAGGQSQGGQMQSPAPEQDTNRSQSESGIQGGRKDTNGVAEPAEEEGGAARGEGTKPTSDQGPPEPEGGYPEQLHAGRLEGLGPEYGKVNRVTVADRLQGVKEEIKGKIKKDPEMQETGKERLAGELKRKQHDEDKNTDPFETADDGAEKKNDKGEEESDPKKHRTEKTDEPGLTEHPQAHPTEKGREEQAASVKPEGSSDITSNAKQNAGSQVA